MNPITSFDGTTIGYAKQGTGPAFLLGHSYGANCCLESTLISDQAARLILYEPDIQINFYQAFPGILEQMQAYLEQGQPEAALEMVMKEFVRMPDHELSVYQQLPMWQIRVSQVKTLPRELEAISHYHFNPAKFHNFATPTLLLLGSDSPSQVQQDTKLLHRNLPNSMIVRMPAEQHIAMDTKPELFIKEVVQFLLG